MKQELVRNICARLERQLTTMTGAAKSTREASTGDEGKAEGKYDTRALEASYLAGAQAVQSEKIARSLHTLTNWHPGDFQPNAEISAGALVETERDGAISHFLLTPCAGGISLDYDEGELLTLSPGAPLYQELLGRRAGDLLDGPGILILGVS